MNNIEDYLQEELNKMIGVNDFSDIQIKTAKILICKEFLLDLSNFAINNIKETTSPIFAAEWIIISRSLTDAMKAAMVVINPEDLDTFNLYFTRVSQNIQNDASLSLLDQFSKSIQIFKNDVLSVERFINS